MTDKRRPTHRFEVYKDPGAQEAAEIVAQMGLLKWNMSASVSKSKYSHTESEAIASELKPLLEHCLLQLNLARDGGDARSEWAELAVLLESVSRGVSRDLTAALLKQTFLLGQVCGELSGLSRQERHHFDMLQLTHIERALPLISNRLTKGMFKKAVLDKATELWKQDSEQSIRVGEMSEKLWSIFVESDDRHLLPNSASGLKAWIRPIAPKFAKRHGAPRKK